MAYFVDQAIETLKEGLTTGDPKKAIKEALKILDDKDRIYISWCVDDILQRAEDTNHKPVTKKKAREILEEMEHHHDANIGITWDTIDFYLDNE